MKTGEIADRLDVLARQMRDIEIEMIQLSALLAGRAAKAGKRVASVGGASAEVAPAPAPPAAPRRPSAPVEREGFLDFIDRCEGAGFILSRSPRAGRYGPRAYLNCIREIYAESEDQDADPPRFDAIEAEWREMIEEGVIVAKPARNAARQMTETMVRGEPAASEHEES